MSTDSAEQLTSYEAQVGYYDQYIKGRVDWAFSGVYSDEGISAVSMKKREGFNRMIADALSGKIDLIVTKSVSRFARNTVDSLTTIRKLKDKGVEVFFEKENIYTFDGKGELLISLMSSLAQEESRSISENVTWGQRKRFADGKVSMPYSQFLGYEKGEDGFPQIVKPEAETIRTMFRLFMEGMTFSAIARWLTCNYIPTPGGKTTWQTATVRSILSNEKYKGDALLQKRFTVDFLTKRIKDNEGEVPQYYVRNSHPAIIPPDEFDAVQTEIQRRKKLGRPAACQSPLSMKLVCADCGGFFGSKVWNSNSKYRRVIWRCNNKYKHEEKCTTPHVTEEEVRRKFVTAFNSVLEYRDGLVADCRQAQAVLCDCGSIQAEIVSLGQEGQVLTELVRKDIFESAGKSLETEELQKRNVARLAKQKECLARVAELEALRQERTGKAALLERYIRGIESRHEALDSFDERLWEVTVEKVTITHDGGLVFSFMDGRTERV